MATFAGRPSGFHIAASPHGSTKPLCELGSGEAFDPTEIEANARLIAAAPEMLHTLKYAEDILQAAASDGRKPSIKDLNDIIEVVRLTIAKAEGR